MRAEFYFNRYASCGNLGGVMIKAFSEAKEIVASGKTISWPEGWPEGEDEAGSLNPIMMYFADGSYLEVADVPSPPSKMITKVTWGIYYYCRKELN